MAEHGILNERICRNNVSWIIKISEIERPGQRARCINLCMQERKRRIQQIRERHVNPTDRVLDMLQRIRAVHAEDMERIVGVMHSRTRTPGGRDRSETGVR